MSGLLAIAITLSFGGCREDLGVELPPDVQRTQVKFIEMELPITSLYLDSLRTDKLGLVHAGVFTEPLLGQVESTGYAEFEYSSGLIANEFVLVRQPGRTDSLADLTFESLTMTLKVDEVLTSEFFINQHLDLWSISDSIFSNGIYLSNRNIAVDEMVGSADLNIPNLNPIDFQEDTIVVQLSLSESFGAELVENFIENGVNVQPKGLAFKGSVGNQIVSYDLINDTTELILTMKGNLYSTDGSSQLLGDTLVTSVFRFSSSKHFTGIERNRAGSAIASAVDNAVIDIDPDYAYFSPTAGIYPKIELDLFKEFSELEPNVLFNRVELIYETQDYIGNMQPIQAVLYYITQDNGGLVNVNWPGILSFPDRFNVLVQSDLSITRQQDIPEYHFLDSLSESTIGYKGFPTLFFQYHYNNIRDDMDNIKDSNRSIVQQWMLDVDDLMIKNIEGLPVARQSISKNSLKLRLFYTQKR